MSKFTKRKHKSIETYDKCPSMSLFRVVNLISRDQNYMCEDGIAKVHLVVDDEARVTERKLDKGSEVYLTTKLLMNILYAHSINPAQSYSDRPKYIYTDKDGETSSNFTPNQQRVYGSNQLHQKSMSVVCVDLLMFMKESKRQHIEVSVDTLLKCDYSDYGIMKYQSNGKVNLKLTSTPLISRRLELTTVKNELLELHKEFTPKTNKIHKCNNAEELICEWFMFPYGEKNKEGSRPTSSKFVSYYVELGGNIDQNAMGTSAW